MNKITFKNRVPKDKLVFHIKKENVICNKTSMFEMFDAMHKEKPQVLKDIYEDYRFSGITCMNVFEIVGFPQTLNNKKSFLAHIQKKLGIPTSILNVTLAPPISEKPQINLIQETESGFIIQWVYGVEVENLDGYNNIISRIEHRYVVTKVMLGSPIFIEVRTGYKISRKYLTLFAELLSHNEHPIELIDLSLTRLSEAEAVDVAERLNAGLLEGEHLGNNGIGRYAISADRDTKDLRKLDEYNQRYRGLKCLSQTLNFSYEEKETGYKTNVKFIINMNGGFEFKTKVSEQIMKRVFDVFVEVRYKPNMAIGE